MRPRGGGGGQRPLQRGRRGRGGRRRRRGWLWAAQTAGHLRSRRLRACYRGPRGGPPRHVTLLSDRRAALYPRGCIGSSSLPTALVAVARWVGGGGGGGVWPDNPNDAPPFCGGDRRSHDMEGKDGSCPEGMGSRRVPPNSPTLRALPPVATAWDWRPRQERRSRRPPPKRAPPPPSADAFPETCGSAPSARARGHQPDMAM